MDERTGDKYDIPDEETYGSALLSLFLFSGLMFTLPIAAFFLGKQWLDENYPLEPPYDQLAPALLAIVLVNVIIVLYVCKALRIEAREKAAGNTRPIEERKKRE